jgi:hypothetical protein
MVRRAVARGMFVVTAVIALGSCQFFQLALDSTFPAAITQMTARRDMSSSISASDAYSFTVGDVVAGGYEFVVLSSSLTTDGIRLIIMDTNLNVLLTLTAQDVAAYSASLGTEPARAGAGASMGPMNIEVGNLLFGIDATGTVVPLFTANVPSGPGFASNVGANYNYTDMLVSGNGFSYSAKADTWLPAGSFGPFSLLALPTANTNFSFRAIFADSDPSRLSVTLVLHNDDDNLDYYFTIPQSDFFSGYIDFTTIPFFTRPATDPTLLGYANGGVFRFVQTGNGARSGAFVRSDLGGLDMPTQFPYLKLPDIRQAYSPAGSFYFVFDKGTRTVTRMTAWWN